MKIQIDDLPAESGPAKTALRTLHSDLCNFPESPWELLFSHAVEIANRQICRRRWRGAFGGVLPDGYDANAIAAQAVADLLRDRRNEDLPELPVLRSLSGGGCLPDSVFCALHSSLFTDLAHRVSRHVDRLRHRKENSLFRNEPDLARIMDDDSELISPVESLPAPDPTPFEALLLKEGDVEVETFRISLGQERRLKTLFDCLCSGTTKPKAVARRLKISVRAVANLRKRLNRHFKAFVKHHSPAKISCFEK